MNNVTKSTMSFDALGDIGFFPNTEDALTPKQKDIFSTSNTFDNISGDDLKNEIEARDKVKEQETELETKQEPVKTIPISNSSETESLANDLQQALKNAPESTEVTEEKEEVKGKTGIVKFLKSRIEKGEFQPYDDYDDSVKLSDYLNKMTGEQLEELLDKNYQMKQDSFKDEYESDFYKSLPGHLGVVAKAIVEGTMDPETAYVALGRVEQSRRLDPSDDNDQISIVQNYLQATQFGTHDEIGSQIEEWKEAGTLSKKANQFKPKLDKMQEEQVMAYTQQAEKFKQEQQEAAQWYATSVENALKDGDLNGVKINRKQQKQLYEDLLLNIKPSARDGKPMNALWHKLEHIQIVEPDFKLLAEINWLANDPQGYREMLKQAGRNEQQGKVTRELKTLQGSGNDRGEELPVQEKRKGGIVKQKNPFDIMK